MNTPEKTTDFYGNSVTTTGPTAIRKLIIQFLSRHNIILLKILYFRYIKDLV